MFQTKVAVATAILPLVGILGTGAGWLTHQALAAQSSDRAVASKGEIGEQPYTVAFSTYVGGSSWEHIRDITTDSENNIYITGGTASRNFFTTPKAYDRTFNFGGSSTGANGDCDIFVMKLGPRGDLIWSTLLGGPNYDRAYAIELDSHGYIYLTGRAGEGFPVTAGAFRTTFQGVDEGPYGKQDGFIAKLSPDGSKLVWASYAHGGRDLAVDARGDVYLASGAGGPQLASLPAAWFTNAYQKTLRGPSDCAVTKISSDGTQVLWSTYFGGSGNEASTASIRVDSKGSPYLLSFTASTDLPTTPGAFQQSFRGVWDMFVAKFSPDGANLIFCTYLGGSGNEFTETHGLALDSAGNAYVGATTLSADFPTTAGAFQRTYGGAGGGGNYPGDGFVAKISPSGKLVASTFLGGKSGEGIEGIGLDAQGDVYVSGATFSTNFPVTHGAFQASLKGTADLFGSKLSADLGTLLYSTYLGGSGEDYGRTAWADRAGNFYIAGEVRSTNFPTANPMQPKYGGGALDAGLAKFLPISPK